MFQEIDWDKIKIESEPPKEEPQRQFYGKMPSIYKAV